MEINVPVASPATDPSPESVPSLLERVVRIFARPGSAWAGLETRVQWWFPMLILMLTTGASGAILYQRAIVPMTVARYEQLDQDGKLPAGQLQKMEEFMTSPAGLAVSVGIQVLITPIITMIMALLIWFGCGFILGTRLKYRLALEVAAWSALITVPSLAVTTWLGWTKETLKGIHVGFGILLPDSDTPSKLMTGLGGFLDGLGPFAIWWLAVAILGATALSGAKRPSVAWVLGGLYLAALVFLSAMGAMFGPGAS